MVESFLKTHNHLIKYDVENLSLIFAGGLSLNQKLRDLIMCKINAMFSINISTNIANTPLRPLAVLWMEPPIYYFGTFHSARSSFLHLRLCCE